MKKILSILVALVILTLTASAQSDGNRPQRSTPEQITNRMAEQLSLTDAQKSQVLTLNTEYQDVIGGPGFGHGRPGGGHNNGQHNGQHNRPDGATGATDNANANHPQRPELTEEQKAKFEEMRTKREEYNTKLKAILTADQYTKYEESQRRGPHGGNGHHGGNGGHKGQKGKKDKNN